MKKIILSFLFVVICGYAILGILIFHHGLHPLGKIVESRDTKTGRTHYVLFRPAGFYEMNCGLFDIMIPVTLDKEAK